MESPEKALGREKVQAEINALRERLGQMPKLAELDKATEKARSEVVNCLRLKLALHLPLLRGLRLALVSRSFVDC